MGLESVIEDVLARGRSEVEDLRQAAAAERDRILRDASAQGAKLLEERERDAKETAERARIQALARTELESKKIVLLAEKELLDQVYAAVLARLSGLAEAETLLRGLLQANEAEWRAGKAYSNEKDANTVRSVAGKNFGGVIDCIGGIVIESADGSRRTDLRFETLHADIWRDSIREVAEVLWPPR